MALAALLISVVCALGGCAGEYENIDAGASIPTEIDLRKLAPGGTTAAFHIDSVNSKGWKSGEVYVVPADSPAIVVNGWGFDIKNKRPAAGIFVNVDGKNEMLVSYGEERKDVAAYFEDENYLKTGFTATMPTASMGQGKHTLKFKIVSADKREFFVPIYKVEIDLR